MMAKKLKPALLDGIKHRETVELEYGGEKYEVEIRPLRHSEVAEVQGLITSGMKVDVNDMIGKKRAKGETYSFDLGGYMRGKRTALLKAAALGTTDPEWTEEKIDELWHPEWVQKVGERVMEISGFHVEEDDLKSFR